MKTVLLAAALCLVAASIASAREPSHTSTRPWLHEEEFTSDAGLRATPENVVILHLTATPPGSPHVAHRIPYSFDATAPFTFCIASDDPHLRRMTLVSGPRSTTVVRLERGDECVHKTIVAGRYDLLVTHDGSGVDARGTKAFLHVPRRYSSRRPAVATASSGSTDTFWGLGLAQCPTAPTPGQLLYAILEVANAGYVVAGPATGASDSQAGPSWLTLNTQAAPTVTKRSLPPGWKSVPQMYWTLCPYPSQSGAYYIIGAPGAFPAATPQSTLGESCVAAGTSGTLYLAPSSSLYTVSSGSSSVSCAAFALQDLGNFQLSMSVVSPTSLNGAVVVLDASNQLVASAASSATAATFNLVATVSFFPPGTDAPPAVVGQVMLGGDPQYGISYAALSQSLADLTWQNPILPFSIVLPVSVGPQTVANFFSDQNYQGSSQAVANASPVVLSFSGFPLSVQIAAARDFVAATTACNACNLSGVDLSTLDLTGGSFAGSTFTGANLKSTKFTNATLSGADFSSVAGTAVTTVQETDFTGATLACVAGSPPQGSFAGTDVSAATFGAVDASSQLTTDFSCRLDFTGATLDVTSIPASVWPYLNLTNATFNNAAGAVLSTASAPLSLRGALLDGANLTGVTLDGADLSSDEGCFSQSVPAQAICTSLNDVVLTSASLRWANLSGTSLEGAHLESANLAGANLCAAHLDQSPATGTSAAHTGAFLQNALLINAKATGATFTNANFYSTTPAATCQPNPCTTTSTCASAHGATLNFATFTGAYLAGTDLSSAPLQAAKFDSAFLIGATLSGATMAVDPNTGNGATFLNALLQGTTFPSGSTSIPSATFESASLFPQAPPALVVVIQLNAAAHVAFPNYTPTAGSTPGCVYFSLNSGTAPSLPATDASNTCPDLSNGPCSATAWAAPSAPTTGWAASSDGSAMPPSCSSIDSQWAIQQSPPS